MVTKDKLFVVVSVLQGRRFPRRPKHQLTVEARFDGELLATDPVSHTDDPDFTQELAWELDKKSLHQHKLQRSSIKVQVYAQDTNTKARESVGYVVLDLRSAGTTQNARWMSLLHSKYSKNKPEARLGIYIDENKGPPAGFKATRAPTRPVERSGEQWDPKELRPELHDLDGYYQVGPYARCQDDFTLSVTIAFASNLPQLIPTSVPLPANANGYFFFYSLLGNDVTNEPFGDLLNPSFPAERASVRLRSSPAALQAYFHQNPGLEVHLCCGDQSLGSCEVPLRSLLTKSPLSQQLTPSAVEGAFVLEPPNRNKSQLTSVAADMRPVVGLSVVLKSDQQVIPQSPVKTSPKKDEIKPPHSPPERLENPKSKESKPAAQPVSSPKTQPRLPSPVSPHDGSYSEVFDSASKASQPDRPHQPAKPGTHDDPLFPPPSSEHQTAQPPAGPPPARPVPDLRLPGVGGVPPAVTQDDVTVRHFCFSIDLRALRKLDVHHPTHVFLRYTYPFFGSAAPIMTHPSVEVRRDTEVVLPHGFCAFDFAATAAQLRDSLTRVPLLLELWGKPPGVSPDLLGTASLPLSNVFSGPAARAVAASGVSGTRQSAADDVTFFTATSPARAVAELSAVLTLEDWGDVAMTTAAAKEPAPAAAPQPAEEAPTRDTHEYRAAMELELWKEKREEEFQQQLKEKEQAYMKVLTDEWKKREKERELIRQKKESEYEGLVEKLKKTLYDLEKRDKQLTASEQEVMRMRTDLQREHERKVTDAREASRRMKEDCDHLVQLERAKISNLEEYIQKLKEQVKEAEVKAQHVEKEFSEYKEKQNTKPEVRLQSEINLLTLEKVELERKLDVTTKSKLHYKQQWGRALKELARFKQKEQMVAMQQLKKEKQEIEHMRLRYLAAEEKDIVKTEQSELQAIKDELNALREAELSKRQASGEAGSPGQEAPVTSDLEDEHVTRLIEERDTLLRTGAYRTDDLVIVGLDKQIKETIARRNREEYKRDVSKAIRCGFRPPPV